MVRAVGGIDLEREIFYGASFWIKKVQPFLLQSPDCFTSSSQREK